MTSRIAISLAALLALSPAAIAQTVTTTTTTVETRGPRLSPEQRSTIYRTVTRERRVSPAPEIQLRVGAPVPREVELYPFPDETYADVPVMKRYKYVYVANRLVVVDPETSEVVDVIDQ
jgi:uncharacterized protein DUF1236